MSRNEPFVGAQPFGENDTIYGRGNEISELRYLIGAKRIVLLYSPSGAGKSSLLRARNGLLNRLRDSGRFEVWGPARVNLSPGGLTVKNRFAWSAINDFEKSRREGVRAAESFADTDLATYIRERAPAKSPLLVFDQFEEVLRIEPSRGRPKSEFFEQLGEALYDPSVWALFVIREDYLAALRPYARMIPTHLQNRYRVNFLRREDQALDAVRGPLEQEGRLLASGAAEAMLASLATQTVLDGDDYKKTVTEFVEPLQLQLVCTELWARIRNRDASVPVQLADFGDLDKALGNYYAGTVKRDDAELERSIREWFDRKLIGPDGVRNMVRKDPMLSAGLPNEVIEELIAGSYLMRQEPRMGSVWFELSHDRLAEPVRKDNREWFEEHLTLLQRSAARWDAKGRPDSMLLLGSRLKKAIREMEQRLPNLKLSQLNQVDREYVALCNGTQEQLEDAKKGRIKVQGCLAYLGMVFVLGASSLISETLLQILAVIAIPIVLIYFVRRWWKPAERR